MNQKSLIIFFVLFFCLVVFADANGQDGLSDEDYVNPVEALEQKLSIDESAKEINLDLNVKNISSSDLPDFGWYAILRKQAQYDAEEGGYVIQPPLEHYLLDKGAFGYLKPGREEAVSVSLKYSPYLTAGEYEVQLTFVNKVQKTLGGHVSKFSLKNDGGGLLKLSGCFLTREGQTFAPEAGANVDALSGINLKCAVFDKDGSPFNGRLIPEFTVSELNVFDFANAKYKDKKNLSPVSVADGNFDLSVKANGEPGSYQLAIRLLSAADESALSAYQTFRYNVRGKGARISDVALDKTYYKRGESAIISYSFFGSPDLYWQYKDGDQRRENGSPLNAELNFKIYSGDEEETICAQASKMVEGYESLGSKEDTVSAPIERNCLNPRVVFSIVDGGKTLSEYNISIDSNPGEIPPKRAGLARYGLAALVLLIASLVILYLIKFRKNKAAISIIIGAIVVSGAIASFKRNIEISQANRQYNFNERSNSLIHVHQNKNDWAAIKNLSKMKPGDESISKKHGDNLSRKSEKKEKKEKYKFSFDISDNTCSNNNSKEWLRVGWFLRDKDNKVIQDRKINKTIRYNDNDNGKSKSYVFDTEIYDDSTSLKISKAPYRLIWDFRIAMFGRVGSGENDWRVYPSRTVDEEATGNDGFYYLISDDNFKDDEKKEAFENAYDISKPDFTKEENITDGRCKNCSRTPFVRESEEDKLRSIYPLTREWTVDVYTELTVSKYGGLNGGDGTVVSKDKKIKNKEINCGEDCSQRYTNANQVKDVKLKAEPDAGSKFDYWSGDCSSVSGATCTVKTDKNRNVTAHFKLKATDEGICDNIDNNGDGEIDEGFDNLGDFCLNGLGSCSSEGVFVCTADGADTVCNAIPESPSLEICDNGIDDDCDGLTDYDDYSDCPLPPSEDGFTPKQWWEPIPKINFLNSNSLLSAVALIAFWL